MFWETFPDRRRVVFGISHIVSIFVGKKVQGCGGDNADEI
jgi:hypothetical protein